MKTLITSILLFSSTAFAYNIDNDIDYVSWCMDNQVMTSDSKGNSVVLADCSNGAEYLVCKQQTAYMGRRPVIVASCKQPKL